MSSANNDLYVTSISVKNAYGLKQALVEPGNITVLSGKNGEGKTSLLKSIEAVFGGGRDASLLNTESDSGEIIIALNDDTVISKKFDKKKHSLSVVRDGKKIPSPQTFLKELTSSIGCNPLILLTASRQERAQYFLDALPVDVDIDELSKITSQNIEETDSHGIVLIDSLYQDFYMERRSVNRHIDRLKKTIDSAKAIVDEFDPDSIVKLSDDLAGLKVERSVLNSEFSEDLEVLNDEFSVKLQSLEKELAVAESNSSHISAKYEDRIRSVDRELELKIAKLKEAAALEKEQINDQRRLELATDNKILNNNPMHIKMVRQEMTSAKSACQNKRDQALMSIDSKIEEKKREIRDANKAEPILEQLKSQNADLKQYESEAGALNQVLKDLLDYKKKLLQNLNIEWFDYRDKKVYIDGVDFEGVNTARLVQVAIELARLQSPRLRLLCLDGIEALDECNFELLIGEAIKSNMNVIVTKVSNDDRVRVESMFGSNPSELEKKVSYAN